MAASPRLSALLARRTLQVALVFGTLVVTACDSASSTAPTAAPTTPAVDLASARTSYLAAATAAQGQARAVQASGCTTSTVVAVIRSCWVQQAHIEHGFNTAVYAIAFPVGLQADARSLVIAAARLEGAMAGLGAAADPFADAKDHNIFASASSDVLTEVAAIRQGLGLPRAPADVPIF